jgi:protein SCO1/2
MKRWLLLVLLLGLVSTPFVLVRIIPRPQPKATVTDIDPKKLFRPRLGNVIPDDITLRDENGATVKFSQFGGDRPYILVPAYYRCPSLCNEVLNDLLKGIRGVGAYQVGKDFDVIVASFDPREEPALARAKKTAYASANELPGDPAGWHFLTGEQDQIDRLLTAIGYKVIWDEKKKEYLHAAGLVICSSDGAIARYFPGLDYRPLYLRMAITEAGRGKVAPSLMDQMLMPCFTFDASKGQYSAAVLTIVKGAGVLTIVALGLTWLVMARRSARRGERRGVSPPVFERGVSPPVEGA